MLMCGVGAKSVADLMKFHLLQWEVVKVKFLIKAANEPENAPRLLILEEPTRTRLFA